MEPLFPTVTLLHGDFSLVIHGLRRELGSAFPVEAEELQAWDLLELPCGPTSPLPGFSWRLHSSLTSGGQKSSQLQAPSHPSPSPWTWATTNFKAKEGLGLWLHQLTSPSPPLEAAGSQVCWFVSQLFCFLASSLLVAKDISGERPESLGP